MAVDQDFAMVSRSVPKFSVSHRRSFKPERAKSHAAADDCSGSQDMKLPGSSQGQGPGDVFLPEEIWSKIFGFLPDFQSRCIARCVCRTWNSVLSVDGPAGRQMWGEHSPVFFLDRNGSGSGAGSGSSAGSISLESVGYNMQTENWERLPPFSRSGRGGRVVFVSGAGGIFCFGTSLEDLCVTLWNPATDWSVELPAVKNFGMYYCRMYKCNPLPAQHVRSSSPARMSRRRADFTIFAAGLKSPRDYSSTVTSVMLFRSGWSGWGTEYCLPDGCNVLVGSVNTPANPGLLYCLVEKSINLRAGMHLLARQRLAVFDLEQGGWISSEEIASSKITVDGKECLLIPNCISEWQGRMFGTAQLRQDTTETYFILELVRDGVQEAVWKWQVLGQNPYRIADMSRQSSIATHDGRIVFTQSSQCNAKCAVDCSGLRTVYDIKSGSWTDLPHSSITRLTAHSQLKKLNMETLKLCNGVFMPNLEDGPANFARVAKPLEKV